MAIFKTILFIIATILLFKAILEEDFDDMFLSMLIYVVSIGLEMI